MSNVPAEKARLRQELLARREALGAGVRNELGERVRRHLVDWISQRKPEYVLLYVATRGEVDILPLAAELKGARFALPLMGLKPGQMTFHAYRVGDHLRKNRVGIYEPDPCEAKIVRPSEQCIVLVPTLDLTRSEEHTSELQSH